jgi:protein-L-isoaspartate(D-aspartate) O-methyltransferase
MFVDEALASRAYEDLALPIGYGQTMSQPYVVALMTQTLGAGKRMHRVLEIGTGCGYQTAVLANLVDEVYTVERIATLFRQTRNRLFDLKYRNIKFLHGDGFEGWPEYAPYDGIMATAAPAEVPRSLLDQLKDGGRIVIPVGGRTLQKLMLIEKTADGFEQREIESVNFVPLISGKI